MPASNFYLQCTLVRNEVHQVSWIPKEIAIKDAVIDLKEDDGSFDRGWTVTTVGTVQRDYAEVNDRGQDYKRTRGASDV